MGAESGAGRGAGPRGKCELSTQEPVLGWRIWRLQGDRLQSWAMEHLWESGENRARCLAPYTRPCDVVPGKHCQCGFWALWSPLHCIAKAREPTRRPWNVVGLIMGWGAVALHGDEGFRSEYASVVSLFTDWPWSAPLPDLRSGRLTTWWHDVFGRWYRPVPCANLSPPPERALALEQAASRYAVPLVSLRAALDLGLFAEWGIPPAQVEEVSRWAGRW